MVTLTGTFTRLDGTPATGKVRVTPSRSPIMDPDGKIVISGPQEFPLGVDGTLSVTIPASNDPDLGPPFTYWIDVNLTHANWKINKVWIPYGSTTVDLSEIADYQPTPGVATRVVTIPADGTDGQVLVWDGVSFAWDFPPTGPQGPKGDLDAEQLAGAPRLTNQAHDITWLTDNATIGSQTPRLAKFTATASQGLIRSSNNMVGVSVYYFAGDVKATSDQVYFGASSAPAYHSGSGDWERLSGQVLSTGNIWFQIRDERTSAWDQIEVRDPVLIDLTTVFGAGREPTKEYMDALLAKHDNYIGGVDQFAVGDALQALTVAGPGMTLRRDTTVGTRVFLDHPGGSTMLHGDTGWRNITDRLINGWTSGSSGVRIRRVMDRVYLEANGIDGTDATSNTFITLPVGWSLGNFLGRRIQIGGETAIYGVSNRTLSLPMGETHFPGGYELAEFTTPDPWPSAQAGTPHTYL